MAKYKKTAADAANIDGGREIGELGSATDSTLKSTTTSPRPQVGIAGLLLRGAENGVGLRDLAAMTGADTRTVRKMIQAERLHGAPILSDNRNGYFLPDSDAEREACVRSLRGRAAEIERTADALEEGGLWLDEEKNRA